MKKLILAAYILEAGLKLYFLTFLSLIPVVFIFGIFRYLISQLTFLTDGSGLTEQLLAFLISTVQLIVYIFSDHLLSFKTIYSSWVCEHVDYWFLVFLVDDDLSKERIVFKGIIFLNIKVKIYTFRTLTFTFV